MEQKNLFRVKISIEGATPQELSKAMISNNLKYNMEFDYTDVSKPGTKWIAWFYAPVDRLSKMDEAKSENVTAPKRRVKKA
jgi:hypothetical protein